METLGNMLMPFSFKTILVSLLLWSSTSNCHRRNYEAKYTKADIPEWKQRACEKPQKNKANSHYICDEQGDVKCLPGWQGDLCQVPMCRRGCDPMNGYCQRPGECRCRIGYSGELCDKCITLPGCQHGYCTKPFECLCKPGWDGLFCTEPTCRQGCHSTRGYCETPGECRCRLGWGGRTCADCSVMPGCQHGTCSKPLECNCLPGYTGLLCTTALCRPNCHKQHGYCRRPGECRCKVGWMGPNCDKCFPYPGCVNGDCEKPWECNCQPGWGGMLCDEPLTFCLDNPSVCENNGRCISLPKDDGSYRCQCKQGYLGKNCEIVDEFLMTSTTPPKITAPPPLEWEEIDKELNKTLERITSNNSKEILGAPMEVTTEKTFMDNIMQLQEIKRIDTILPLILKKNSSLTDDKSTNLTLREDNEAIEDYKRRHSKPLVFPTMVVKEPTTYIDLSNKPANEMNVEPPTSIFTPTIIGTATATEETSEKIVVDKQKQKVSKKEPPVAEKEEPPITNKIMDHPKEPKNSTASNDGNKPLIVIGEVEDNDGDTEDNEEDEESGEDGDGDEDEDEDEDDEEDDDDQLIPNIFANVT